MKTSLHIRALSFAFCTMLFLFGCDSASTNDDVVDDDTTTDVATTVALSVSEEDGGVADQLEDVVAITSELSLNKDEASHATIFSRQPEYDESTGTWTVEIDRDRTSANGQRSMSYQRTYTYQFLDANGQPQQFFTTDSTRAKTVIFRILEGSGEYASPEVVNSLNALTADWTIDNADEDVFSISGSYFRDASSTIERTLVTRTMDHALHPTSVSSKSTYHEEGDCATLQEPSAAATKPSETQTLKMQSGMWRSLHPLK